MNTETKTFSTNSPVTTEFFGELHYLARVHCFTFSILKWLLKYCLGIISVLKPQVQYVQLFVKGRGNVKVHKIHNHHCIHNPIWYFVGYVLGHACGVTMATAVLEIARHLLQKKRKLLLLLPPHPCPLRPCCLCRPLRTLAARREGRRRCGCLCLATWVEPSCWPAWPSARPGTSGMYADATRRHAVYMFDLALSSCAGQDAELRPYL